MLRKGIQSVKSKKCLSSKKVKEGEKTKTRKKQKDDLVDGLTENRKKPKMQTSKRKRLEKETQKKKRVKSTYEKCQSPNKDIICEDDNQIFQSTSEDFFPRTQLLRKYSQQKQPVRRNEGFNHIRNYYLVNENEPKEQKQQAGSESSNGSETKKKILPCKIIKCSKIPFPVHPTQKKSARDLKNLIEKTQGISEIKPADDHDYFPSCHILVSDFS